MLIFTNRAMTNQADASAFGTSYQPAAERLGLAHVRPGSRSSPWTVSDVNGEASDEQALSELLPLFAGPRPVLVHLHGNNNTPTSCFERSALFESIYDLEVIGFSWPSEGYRPDGSRLDMTLESSGDESNLRAADRANRPSDFIQDKIQRYHQAKTNAKNSIDALARFLRLLGVARLAANGQPFSVAAHSLGVHFLQNTLAVSGAVESLGTAHNIALLAACARAAGHREWLARLHPRGQIFVTFNNRDLVLAGAFFADNEEIKLGDRPGAELLQSPSMRYIDFTGASNDAFNHNYFVAGALKGKKKRVLRRIFASESDIQPGELPRKVYPVGCDKSVLTCFMAAPQPRDGGGP